MPGLPRKMCNIAHQRAEPTTPNDNALKLGNGKVLVIGGVGVNGTALASAELYQ